MGKNNKKAAPRGQKSIAHFFRAPTTAAEKSSLQDEEMGQVEKDDEPMSDGEEVPGATTKQAIDASDLPPIHDIPAMFSDLVSHVPDIKQVVEHVQGRKLRIATMCSGTESPLLALELIQKSIAEQHGVALEIEHVFSCEIEPFKQAYIERNFHPPLLFRDVCELGDGHATTAYGASAPVPGDVDLLVAGTSCVDYSNLNNEKQTIDGNGESGRTFRGMMSWVQKHRPPIVILENVCSAPWDRVAEYFEKNGYSATHTRVDTKHFYIPHTRTRVYLVAINKKKSSMAQQWKELLMKLKRPASSSLDAFLLPSDDPRIHQSRQKLVQESYNALDRRTGRTDWGRCESRHQRARLEEGLGSKRPLTGWDEGGFCKLPDYAWNDWGVGQVERVWDLMDITLLRSAKTGVDPSYKTLVWNLSQNVDRTIGSSKLGICPCLTPSMIPYITNRGGPMVGLEALSMQGLPVDKLLLTRESEDQLADLAGNAMSTTVVGACILAALVVGQRLLKSGNDQESYESKHSSGDRDGKGDAMNLDKLADALPPIEDHIIGEDQLMKRPLDLSVTVNHSLPDLLARADMSARLCTCEGRKDITDRPISRCTDCWSSCCKKCGGRPEHNMETVDFSKNPRLLPSTFAKDLKSVLPMRLSILNVTQDILDELRSQPGISIPAKRWSSWCKTVLRASENELRFMEPKRQEIWSAVYHSPTARLELLLHPRQPEWRLYGIPEEREPANAEIRRLLDMPIARFICEKNLLHGRWQFALPCSRTVSIEVEGTGELVPSWEAKLGLIAEEFVERKVYSQLKITVPPEERSNFDRDVSGVYSLLDKCGTANNALHKNISTSQDTGLPPLFMLLDPTRCGEGSADSFIFSTSIRRYEFGESRPVICRLDSTWRQSSAEGIQSVQCFIPYKWMDATAIQLMPYQGQDAHFSAPESVLNVELSADACRSANALLVCTVDLHSQAGPAWPLEEWKEVDKVHERETFRAISFLTERIRNIDDSFTAWQQVEMSEIHDNCERCAPPSPTLRWAKMGNKMVALEDSIEAGEYERRLKSRPTPFVTQLKLDASGIGSVRIGFNVASLLHRALSRLPQENHAVQPKLSWRLDADYTTIAKLSLPKFQLKSNKLDVEHPQPPSFKIPLRKEQLRSLEWMLKRESSESAPFVEEEISEAILEPLGWRAEGRAERPKHVRGGVLADQVGYGKTAITLGLIDCAAKDVEKEFSNTGDIEDKIPVKATLVVVPPHLTKQWDSETRKFAKGRFKNVVISTAANLNGVTIDDIQNADLVIVASNLFQSSVYLANLEAFAGAGPLPARDGRYFDARLDKTIDAVKGQVERLKNEGSSAVMKEIKAGRSRTEAEESKAFVPTKRLKGKSYREAAEVSEDKPPATTTTTAAQGPTAGLKVEVIIRPKRLHSASSSDAEEVEGDENDSDIPRQRRQRISKRLSIVISDDEEAKAETSAVSSSVSDTAPLSLSNGRKRVREQRKTTSSPSSDYEDEGAAEDNSDDNWSDTSDDEPQKKKQKPSKKTSAKRSSASSASSDADDKMDVDESESKPKKTVKKRKADGNEDRPAKKAKRREETDPWKLNSYAVQKDWTQMHAPPLEMFHFARKVIDEYTYLDGKIHSVVTRITAERQWVLSGTPPIHDFAALKTIAAFLNLHLGIDDDGEGQSAQVKKRRREQTAVERFHSFREVHSLEWHAHRHELGQAFLDHFVRQNIAEIDEIPCTEKIERIDLPAAERAIYLELEHHLRALDMTIKRGKKTEGDREKRLAKSLGESNSAEEALLKRCSHFDLDTTDKENAMKACEIIVKERTKQLDECRAQLLRELQKAVKVQKQIGKTGDESLFQEYVRVQRNEGSGDVDATEVVNKLLDEAGIPAPLQAPTNRVNVGRSDTKKKDDGSISKKTKDLIWEHREHAHDIRRLTKELVGRVRSLRFFKVVRDLQRSTDQSSFAVDCPRCQRKGIPTDEIAVLSSCGHTGCLDCVKNCAEAEECVYAASKACNAAARVLNIVRGDTLGVDDEARDGRGKHFGLKLEKVIELIKKRLSSSDRVLIFVQFPDLMKKVAEALTANKVDFLEIRGTATQKSNNLQKFQDNSHERVLLLNVMDESASGANLTGANHAVFLSPLLAPTQEIYDACETQAIGRLRRYGQRKHVYVWRFLSTNTIDEQIYEQRTKRLDSKAEAEAAAEGSL